VGSASTRGLLVVGPALFRSARFGLAFCGLRFFAFVPGMLALMTVYMRTRKLVPLIFARWIIDVIGAVTTLSI
jgi:hypothetical protein